MFWSCFASGKKGLGFIQLKEYRGINQDNYIEHIIPLITQFKATVKAKYGPGFAFQQDNAPSYHATAIKNTLITLGIELVRQPAYSLDLSPIKTVWAWMKDQMKYHCKGDI